MRLPLWSPLTVLRFITGPTAHLPGFQCREATQLKRSPVTERCTVVHCLKAHVTGNLNCDLPVTNTACSELIRTSKTELVPPLQVHKNHGRLLHDNSRKETRSERSGWITLWKVTVTITSLHTTMCMCIKKRRENSWMTKKVPYASSSYEERNVWQLQSEISYERSKLKWLALERPIEK